MPFDPETLVARTNAGDAELITPTHGLALGQRRLLSQLESPRGFDELVAEHALDAAKTERDLTKLAQRGLVMLQMPSPRMTGDGTPPATAMAGSWRRRLPWPMLVGCIAFALAVYKFVASPPPVDKPDNGILRKIANLEFRYKPKPGFAGTDKFVLRVCGRTEKGKGCSTLHYDAVVTPN